jgi:hypothetical protein
MSRHESPEIGAMIGRMMNALIRRAEAGDWEALEALAEIEALAPKATNAGLALAHGVPPEAEGYSFGTLAGVMGTSRPAVAQRVARATGRDECGHLGCLGMKRCRA